MDASFFDRISDALADMGALMLGVFGLTAWNHHGRLSKLEANHVNVVQLLEETCDEARAVRQHLLGMRPGEKRQG